MSDDSKSRGRPTLYTTDLALEICRRLAGGESLRAICRGDEMPHESTVRAWAIDDHDGFYTQYARARELQMEAWADEIVEISDDGTNDWIARQFGQGKIEEVVNHEYINRSRLRVDTRKWLLSKLKPGTYGDKIQHANAAGDGNQELVYRWAETEDK